MLKRAKEITTRYQKYITPLAILVGFLFDTITLTRIDRTFDNLVFITHILIIGIFIIILFAKNTKNGIRFKISEREKIINTVIIFSFGALFSGFIIFYSRSGSLASSWPFILLLALLMLGTEIRRRYYENIVFQISFYYLAIFSYLIFFLPVILTKINAWVFIGSGISSLVFIFLYTKILKKIDIELYKTHISKVNIRIIVIFLVFNLLYFTNIIPPIPLSLKTKGVYYDIEVIDRTIYQGTYEKHPWYNFLKKQNQVIQKTKNEPVYVFTAVFAPTKLETNIFHSWYYYDKANNDWIKTDRIQIPITGGRDGGFRGYSMKKNTPSGKWKVVIETERGQRLGQTSFKIEETNIKPNLFKEQL